METNSDMVFGRRVYFLCPEDAVRNDLVFKIIQNEFEVYVLDDADIAREILAGTTSILFVNIDAPAPRVSWEDYIIALKASDDFSRVGIGVVTRQNSKELRELYIMGIGVECGVVTLHPGLENVAHVIMEVLRSNDAVGRRNSVRVDCAGDPSVRCYFEANDGTLEAQVVNLSSQGVACADFAPRPPRPQEYFPVIRLVLQGREVSLSGRFFDSRDTEEGPLYITIYDRVVDANEREKVHKFVQQRLQDSVNSRLLGLRRLLEKRRRRRIVKVAALSAASLVLIAGALYFLV